MPNEAPPVETANVDFATLLRDEQAGLRAQLKELGFDDQGSGLNYDSNFADSSQVTAERGEAERLASELKETLEEVEAAIVRLEAGSYGRARSAGSRSARPAWRPCPPPASASPTPPSTNPVRPPGAPSGRRRPMDRRTKQTLWIAAAVVVFVALVVHHNITTNEIVIFCVMVPSIVLHEVSHGYVANAFGDDTAKRAGRLTLNPVPHVDPVGTLLVPALLSLGWVGFFGWAKPVPVNVGRLRSPRNQGVLVSLSGPAVNAALAAIFGVLFVQFVRPGVLSSGTLSTGAQVVFYASLVNVGLFVFNMIPVPPLDGSVLFERLLPTRVLADLPQVPPVHDAHPARPRDAQLLLVPARTAHVALRPALQLVGGRARHLTVRTRSARRVTAAPSRRFPPSAEEGRGPRYDHGRPAPSGTGHLRPVPAPRRPRSDRSGRPGTRLPARRR